MKNIKITIVVENTASMEGLLAEHGLSVWIETPNANILFDTGQGPALPQNAAALKIPLERANAIVLSHGHYDHTGGLPHALERAPKAKVFLHPEAFAPRFSIRDTIMRAINMPYPAEGALKSHSGNIVHTAKSMEVVPGVWVTGAIPRRNKYEDTGGPFFLDKLGLKPDPIPDDQALWLDTADGTVVVLGCAHAGVVNTLEYISELSGASEYFAVMGGMHLARATVKRLGKTAEALERFHVKQIAAGHCTGANAIEFLARRLPGRMIPCAAGSVFAFDGSARQNGP
ncbi:MAG TPA: MBL fold metallo-hydrolase [Kiritimatiellia bacterium]|nr:MBL fold metallo-hydrolase [Kiritimatiellia bacterium]HNS81485.1 MBL fold metallo-hydrolase [Kiritimatiellia bacterium]